MEMTRREQIARMDAGFRAYVEECRRSGMKARWTGLSQRERDRWAYGGGVVLERALRSRTDAGRGAAGRKPEEQRRHGDPARATTGEERR